MSTHAAVVTVAPRAPLEIHQVNTPKPEGNEVRVRVEWTNTGPLDLHKADGGLLVSQPEVLGGGIAGTIVQVGEDVTRLGLGDRVFGYGWRSQKEKAHQIYTVMPENLLAKLPSSISMQQAVTVPTNLVTVFHTCVTDLGIELPWPKPADYKPANPQSPILIWGGSSSVGQYAIQVLSHYGYKSIIGVASKRQHELLISLGATQVLDYNAPDIIESMRQIGNIPYIMDCIGSQSGSLAPISQVAESGSKVAIMLPVVVRDATESVEPIYSMDVSECAAWKEGVDARGVRTHFYLQNDFFAQHLQPEIVPTLIEQGVVKPNKFRIVQGKSMLARAQAALDMLRRKEVSGERLVWEVAQMDVFFEDMP